MRTFSIQLIFFWLQLALELVGPLTSSSSLLLGTGVRVKGVNGDIRFRGVLLDNVIGLLLQG